MLVGSTTGLEKIRNPYKYGHAENEKREDVYNQVVYHDITSHIGSAYAPCFAEAVTRVTKCCEHGHARGRLAGKCRVDAVNQVNSLSLP